MPNPQIQRDVAAPPCANGTVVPSLQGLNYTLYCDWDTTGDDLGAPTEQGLQECVDSCTTQRPACFAAVLNPENGHCYHRHGSSSYVAQNLVRRTGFRSVVVSASQMAERQNVSDHQCPYPNLSTQKTKAGMEFQVFCGAYILAHEAANLLHTQTMEECMERCADNHPLCNSVSFNTDIIGSGWLNCLIRMDSDLVAVPYTRTLAHSAIFLEPSLGISGCRNDSVVKGEDGRIFRRSCNDLRKLDDANKLPISMSHETSFERCLQTCSKANSTCKTFIFDVGLRQGFQNCYLFDSFPPVGVRDDNVTFVYLESLSSQYQPPPTQHKVPPNRAWIAGPVMGSVAGFALVVALICYWHRRTKVIRDKKCKKLK